jgi:N-acetylglucosamine-6-phosphate deacetylase
MIRGIHLEGPFISGEDGPRGAHVKKFCIPPDSELVKQWQDAAGGLIRLITLAPELPSSGSLVRYCVKSGITVGIGHTAASADQLKEAVDNGASLSTHLGNGAHKTLPRHPNYIWEQLAEDRLYASMIADGFHLPDSVLKVFIMVKRDKAILISDGMQYTGMKPGSYTSPQIGGVVLCPDGRLHLESSRDVLAGSARTLREGIQKIMSFESPDLAWDMASLNPSVLMNLDTRSGIRVGAPADLVTFEKSDNNIKILRVILNGLVYTLN